MPVFIPTLGFVMIFVGFLPSIINRDEFLKFYIGNEINPNFKIFLDTNEVWKKFFQKI